MYLEILPSSYKRSIIISWIFNKHFSWGDQKLKSKFWLNRNCATNDHQIINYNRRDSTTLDAVRACQLSRWCHMEMSDQVTVIDLIVTSTKDTSANNEANPKITALIGVLFSWDDAHLPAIISCSVFRVYNGIPSNDEHQSLIKRTATVLRELATRLNNNNT